MPTCAVRCANTAGIAAGVVVASLAGVVRRLVRIHAMPQRRVSFWPDARDATEVHVAQPKWTRLDRVWAPHHLARGFSVVH